jgi:hypothetical protein
MREWHDLVERRWIGIGWTYTLCLDSDLRRFRLRNLCILSGIAKSTLPPLLVHKRAVRFWKVETFTSAFVLHHYREVQNHKTFDLPNQQSYITEMSGQTP